jgi:polysaccharide chain length determinant protein (PEP-CTERM system associated)
MTALNDDLFGPTQAVPPTLHSQGLDRPGVLELAWAVWRRRKWLAILVFAVPFTAGASLVAFAPNVYESTATVLVDRQQVPEAFVRPTVTSELEIRLRSISQEVLSRSRLEAIISRFGLYPRLRTLQPTETIIELMRRDVRLDLKASDPRRRGSTFAFAISYRGPDADTVAQVTNALAFSYVEENLKAREQQATGTTQFLKAQLQETRKRLDEQERRVSQFNQRNLGELPQQMGTNLGMIDRLDAQLRLNIDNQTRLSERRVALARRGDQSPVIIEDRLAGGGTRRLPPETPAETLARLQQELRQLRVRYTDQHPDVVRMRAAIADLEKEVVTGPAPAFRGAQQARSVARAPLRQPEDELEAELRALKAEERRLRDSIAAYVGRVQNTPRLEQELKEISRDYESTKEQYASLSKRYEEAELAESMEQRQKGEQFRILDPALPSAVPAAPHRPRLILVAAALSLGLAVGAVILAESLDTSFHSRDTLRGFTGARVISLPRMVLGADARRQQRRLYLGATGTTLLFLLIVGLSYYFMHGSDHLVRW